MPSPDDNQNTFTPLNDLPNMLYLMQGGKGTTHRCPSKCRFHKPTKQATTLPCEIFSTYLFPSPSLEKDPQSCQENESNLKLDFWGMCEAIRVSKLIERLSGREAGLESSPRQE